MTLVVWWNVKTLTHSLIHSFTHALTRKTKSKKRKTKCENKTNLDFDEISACIWQELFDWRKTLTHSCTQTLNSKNMKQTYYRKAKSEKRKAKNEKRKAKNKKNLDTDEMNVSIWHELFDWRQQSTHSLSHSLTHSITQILTHTFMYSDP